MRFNNRIPAISSVLTLLPSALIPLAPAASAATYYVSNSGNDGAAGTSAGAAWRTAARVGAARLSPGDRVLFKGGQTFAAPLRLGANASGTASSAVTFGSYGAGRATISAAATHGDAITVQGVTGVTLQNLDLVGAGVATGQAAPAVGLRLSDVSAVKVDRVETSGFQWAGIEMSGAKGVTVTRVNAHDNGYAGISSDGGYVGNTPGGRSSGVLISDCQADDNSGDPYFPQSEGGSYNGNGVVLFGISHVTVRYCEAARNARAAPDLGGGGPVGIWAAHADHVLFQYDIAHDNDSGTGTDGGGFDLDGGVSDSVIEYSYAYGNASLGFYLFEYGSGERWDNNVVRYSISVNNARKHDSTEFDASYAGDSGFSRALAHHNFFYNDDPGTLVLGSRQGLRPGSYAYYDNVAIGATGDRLVGGGESISNPFLGNAYLALDGSKNLAGYDDLAAWRDATGQETFDGASVGTQADPQLRGPLAPPPPLIDPHRLTELAGYRVAAGSPLLTAGIDVAKAGVRNVATDFFGGPASAAIGVDGGDAPPPAAPLLSGGDFANGVGGFSIYSAEVRPGAGLDGGAAAVLTGAFAGVWTTISGLHPGATYEISAYLRSSTPQSGAYVYAKQYAGDGSLVEGEVTNTRAFTRSAATFRMGPTQTTAEVGVFKTSGAEDAVADDIWVREIVD